MKFALALAAAALLSMSAEAAQSLLVVTKQSHVLAIVDAKTLKVTGTVPIGDDPHEVIVGPDNQTAYISHFGQGLFRTLAVVDLVHAKALPDIDVSPLVGPHGLVLRGHRLWFTTDHSKALAAMELPSGKITTVIGTGQDQTHMLWVSDDETKLVASNAQSGTFSVVEKVADPADGKYGPGWKHTLVPVGMGAEGFAVSPDRRTVWVGNADGRIPIIDLATNSVTATVDAGTVGANRLAFTPDGKYVVVTQKRGPDLVVIDAATRTVFKRIPIEQNGASGIQMDPSGKRVFIACPRDHYVAVVDLKTMTMTARIDAGREPDGLTWWVH